VYLKRLNEKQLTLHNTSGDNIMLSKDKDGVTKPQPNYSRCALIGCLASVAFPVNDHRTVCFYFLPPGWMLLFKQTVSVGHIALSK